MRVALIGLGEAGRTLHLPALNGLSGVSVVGAADAHTETHQRVADRWKIPLFEDAGEVVSKTRPDVVVIGTPPSTHRDFCLLSLEAGAHVICEKPFVSSVAEANDVIATARRLGRRVALNHEYREMPIFRAIRNAVGTPEVGDLVFAQAWQNVDLPPWNESGWRGQLRQRALYEAGVHLIDFLIALFRESPIAVSTTLSRGIGGGRTADAVALATLEFSGGRIAQVTQNRLCKGERQYFEVRAEGTKASLRASFGGRARVTAGLFRGSRPSLRAEFGMSGIAWRENGLTRTFLARNPREPRMRATRWVFDESLAAFANGSAVPTSAEDARAVLEVIAACYYSASTGKRILLDPPIPEVHNLRMGIEQE